MIRLVGPEDHKEWIRMRADLWPNCPYEEHLSETSAMIESKVIDKELSWVIFVYEREEGHLGGFIEVSEKVVEKGFLTNPIPYIEGWYMDPDLRGKGIGKSLVEKTEEWARLEGFTEIGSDADLDNDLSIAIHKWLGYQVIGSNDESLLFKKNLK
jgi:aminoglycoside 6'-N-acetyltransferase I